MKRATIGSAGYDIVAPKDMTINTIAQVVDTGVSIAGLECEYDRWFMLVTVRSSFAFRHGLHMVGGPAIIDMDYTGTIKLKMRSDIPCVVKRGERIAQGIILPFGVFTGEETPTSERNGGIGSTGR